MKYARYDQKDGRLIGLYDDKVHKRLPSRTVPITDEQAEHFVQNGHTYAYNESTGEWVKRGLTYLELEQVRKDARAAVDGMAAQKRSEYLTLTPGQDTVYALKYAEALAFVQTYAREGDLDSYPLLEAEYLALRESELAFTPAEVARQILEKRDACVKVIARIEKIRRTAKERISRLSGRDPIEATVKRAAKRLEELDR